MKRAQGEAVAVREEDLGGGGDEWCSPVGRFESMGADELFELDVDFCLDGSFREEDWFLVQKFSCAYLEAFFS